ncbi:hypothetical protein GCM10025867_25330 [Frondihabitans sucicola]|uniref:CBM6 domain-containing protein n=1 Tax=Frondihabitans sucicola TaxID=1268041 RepID=A0ABN6XZ26_9MICO|nr:glycoside hydrolase family 76 protein [Frondihabitans sucicola]BDZ50292.1 hypothetical protein GCM10025867_25330 [Frondihabitans sucicola]
MKRSRLVAGLAATATLTAGLVGVSAFGTTTKASALSPRQADTSYNSFIKQYWDPQAQYFYTYSDHKIHPEHAFGPQGGLYSDYWWEAQNWQMVMDKYERSHDPASRKMIDAVFDGWQKAYPDFRKNDFNDDMGWWAQGSIRAYQLTGEKRFLTEAETIFGYISQFEDTTYGGGIWWQNINVGNGDLNQKNVATNGPAIATAVNLYKATGDKKYLDTAKRLFAWLDKTFNVNGHLGDDILGTNTLRNFDFTYNQGDFADAATQLYVVTHDSTYLKKARQAVDWSAANLTESGTYLDEGNNDTGAFKAILTRSIRNLIDDAHQRQYERLLTLNGSQAANHLDASGIAGTDWQSPAPSITTTPQQSVAAAGSVAIQEQARPDYRSSAVTGTGVYEAENAGRVGVANSSTLPGYTGRGYVSGWGEASSVTFPTNVARPGLHRLAIRYAAPAGSATRQLVVNGKPAATLTLPKSTGWRTTSVWVKLPYGSNAVELLLSAASGGAGDVDLDSVTLAP